MGLVVILGRLLILGGSEIGGALFLYNAGSNIRSQRGMKKWSLKIGLQTTNRKQIINGEWMYVNNSNKRKAHQYNSRKNIILYELTLKYIVVHHH